MAVEDAGSDGYQAEHMGLIFEDGLSFSGFERDCVFIGDGAGRFTDLSAVSGADHVGDGRALVVADFDDDGDADVFLHNIQRERHVLYRNDVGVPNERSFAGDGDEAGGGAFLKVRLRGTASAPDAAGALVRVGLDDGRTTAQVLALGSGFVSQNAPELVFGLADTSSAAVEVVWPGGRREDFGRVDAGSRVLLVEGSGEPASVPARTFRLPDPLPPGLRVRQGDRLDRLTVLDADGEERRIDLRSDGGTLVNLWATTCATCVAEIPDLEELNGRDGVRVIGVSVDAPSDRSRAAGVLEKRGGTYANWFLDGETMSAVADPDRLMIPTTLRLSPDGTIAEVIVGPVGS